MNLVYKGIIFDLDMTLVDSRCAAHHRARMQWDRVNTKVSQIRPFNGVAELIQNAKRKKIPLGIVTAGSNLYCEKIVQSCGFGINNCVCYKDAKPKPDPEGFLKAASLLGVHPSQVIAIGDRYEDILGAKRAGMISVAALWACTAIPRVRKEKPHYECKTVSELAALLELA